MAHDLDSRIPTDTRSDVSFFVNDELRALLSAVRSYIEDEVLPAESGLNDRSDPSEPWSVVERLRESARSRGIFTPQLPRSLGGLELGMLGMAHVHEACGVSMLASLGLNATPPDEGNMHLLLAAGTAEQKDEFLRPLATGTVRSCFAMSEPDVASSDALNVRTTAVRDGDEWVINGWKFHVTGANGAAFALVVARTEPVERRYKAHSLIIVPTNSPGWAIVREPKTTHSRYPGGQPEIRLTDVRVPIANLLGEEGDAFSAIQRRLTRGRLSHSMRWIGLSQRVLDVTARRMLKREAFGSLLVDKQVLRFFVADSAIDLYASRMMVLNAAWKIDKHLEHRQEVAMVKTFVSEAFGRITDRAVQVFGSHGILADEPIAQWYADARATRIYDGPNEAHRMTIAKNCLRLASEETTLAAACGRLA